MRFSVAASVVFAAVVSANSYSNGTDYTTTEVVTSYTTYCPGPTTIVEGGNTYTVTEATTLTITDCPCTLTKTYGSVPAPTQAETSDVPVPEETEPAGTAPAGSAPAPAGTGAVPSGYNNETTPSTSPSSPAAPSSTNPPYEGSASRATVAGGALAGLLGVVAYLL